MFSLSLEVFPPKDTWGLDNNLVEINNLIKGEFADLKFDYISVTYGANGGNRDKAYSVALAFKELGFSVVSHLTCVHASKEEVEERIRSLKKIGIKSILALRGDNIPGCKELSYFEHTTDLMVEETELLKDVSVGVACYPELFNGEHSIKNEVKYLKMKQDLGAKFAITQVFFDNSYYYTFVRYAREAGVTIPIYPGIMPITSVKAIYKMARLCGATIPSALYERLQRYVGNDRCMMEVGVNFAAAQIDDLIAHGVPGIHIYSMNNPKALKQLLKRIRNVIAEEQKNDR